MKWLQIQLYFDCCELSGRACMCAPFELEQGTSKLLEHMELGTVCFGLKIRDDYGE